MQGWAFEITQHTHERGDGGRRKQQKQKHQQKRGSQAFLPLMPSTTMAPTTSPPVRRPSYQPSSSPLRWTTRSTPRTGVARSLRLPATGRRSAAGPPMVAPSRRWLRLGLVSYDPGRLHILPRQQHTYHDQLPGIQNGDYQSSKPPPNRYLRYPKIKNSGLIFEF